MIIDVHAHLGCDVVFDEEQSEEQLITSYYEHNIHGAIVQPYICRPYLEDTRQIHNRIYELTKNKDKRFWGMASINPHFKAADYDKEAVRCIKELGFVGLKITPIAHAVHPSSKDALHTFEIARELNVPLMIHTGAGVPFSDPISVINAIESFKDVIVVLAHAGSEMHNQQATFIAKKYDNVYLEPSWVGVIGLEKMVQQVGCGKIMFSSDSINNIPVELAKYRSVIKNQNDLDKVFALNAMKIYKLTI
ncbi:MAG: putative metal-dependent hydrolase of the TIM-barrel fold [Firmicutes bacterium]|nr:putative metal-dependent hydrolase of the TIM-barrel fold [Bacillota bacterium]